MRNSHDSFFGLEGYLVQANLSDRRDPDPFAAEGTSPGDGGTKTPGNAALAPQLSLAPPLTDRSVLDTAPVTSAEQVLDMLKPLSGVIDKPLHAGFATAKGTLMVHLLRALAEATLGHLTLSATEVAERTDANAIAALLDAQPRGGGVLLIFWWQGAKYDSVNKFLVNPLSFDARGWTFAQLDMQGGASADDAYHVFFAPGSVLVGGYDSLPVYVWLTRYGARPYVPATPNR